jgi:hypothetical protein
VAEDIKQRINDFKRRLAEFEEDASSWLDLWRDVQTYVMPGRGKLKRAGDKANDGKKKHSEILNAAPTKALDELAAGMHNHLCSPVKRWFKIALKEREFNEFPGVRPWLEDCTRRCELTLQSSSFYKVALSTFKEIAGFGTGVYIMDTDPLTPLIFTPLTIGEYWLGLDHELKPDTLYRRMSLTVYQAVTQFGIDNVSPTTKSAYAGKNMLARVTVIHVIQPRMTRTLEKGDPKQMAWESVYFEEAESDRILSEGGYKKCPFSAPTWATNSTDTYGRSPFMDSMGDIKMLQWTERKGAEAFDKLINPPMRVPSQMKNRGGASIAPGAQNIIDGPAGEGLSPILQIQYPMDLVDARIAAITHRIRENCFTNLFLAISEIERQMTATEVRQRTMEKLTVLGPVVQQLQNAMFSPTIERVFDVLWERRELPEPPAIIMGRPWTIEYMGFLAQAQRGADSTVVDQMLNYAQLAANAQSLGGSVEVLDKIDLDQTMDELGDMLGAPARMIRTDEQVQMIRMNRAAAMQQQQQMQQMQAAAQSAKLASETKLGDGKSSALDAVLGQQQ